MGKQKEKINLSRPQLWMGYYNNFDHWDTRFRILYPDGTAIWANTYRLINYGWSWQTKFNGKRGEATPCWLHRLHAYGDTKNIKVYIKQMRKYDEAECRKTIFLGYL